MDEPDFLRRTRASYDALAGDYAEWIGPELAAKPLDRALLDLFAELVLAADAGPVADIGCGPGRVTAHLHDLGLSVCGIDLSPRMVAVARQTYPGLRFAEGSLDFHQRQPDRLAELLRQAGLAVRAHVLREPDVDGDFTERTRQGYLLAHKPSAPD